MRRYVSAWIREDLTPQRPFEDPRARSTGVLRRFLQHVLPKGFMKVRYYGFLSPPAKLPLEDIKALVDWPMASP